MPCPGSSVSMVRSEGGSKIRICHQVASGRISGVWLEHVAGLGGALEGVGRASPPSPSLSAAQRAALRSQCSGCSAARRRAVDVASDPLSSCCQCPRRPTTRSLGMAPGRPERYHRWQPRHCGSRDPDLILRAAPPCMALESGRLFAGCWLQLLACSSLPPRRRRQRTAYRVPPRFAGGASVFPCLRWRNIRPSQTRRAKAWQAAATDRSNRTYRDATRLRTGHGHTSMVLRRRRVLRDVAPPSNHKT